MKKDDKNLENKIKQMNIDNVSVEFNLEKQSDTEIIPMSTEQQLLNSLLEVKIKTSQTIHCVERHQRTKIGFQTSDALACYWGKKRESATTCGNCPFGVKLMEFIPKNDPKIILSELEKDQVEKNIYFH